MFAYLSQLCKLKYRWVVKWLWRTFQFIYSNLICYFKKNFTNNVKHSNIEFKLWNLQASFKHYPDFLFIGRFIKFSFIHSKGGLCINSNKNYNFLKTFICFWLLIIKLWTNWNDSNWIFTSYSSLLLSLKAMSCWDESLSSVNCVIKSER